MQLLAFSICQLCFSACCFHSQATRQPRVACLHSCRFQTSRREGTLLSSVWVLISIFLLVGFVWVTCPLLSQSLWLEGTLSDWLDRSHMTILEVGWSPSHCNCRDWVRGWGSPKEGYFPLPEEGQMVLSGLDQLSSTIERKITCPVS